MSERDFERSARGFKHMTPLAGGYPSPWTLRVYESSAAEEPAVWIAAESNHGYLHEVHAHLTLEEAARFAEQIAWLVANHYSACEAVFNALLAGRADTEEGER